MFTVLSSWASYCESSAGSFDQGWMQNSTEYPPTFRPSLSAWASGLLQAATVSTSSFITTQPESRCLFYRLTEGRRLSERRWLVTYKMVYLPTDITHPSINHAQCTVTLMIKTNVIPFYISQTFSQTFNPTVTARSTVGINFLLNSLQNFSS